MTTKSETFKRSSKDRVTKREPDIKDAINAAINYMKRILNVKNVLLEEIDQTEDSEYWLFTLSHENLSKDKRKRTLSDYVTIPIDRSYRVIKMNKTKGTISSMKIREI
jgi:hypothetical protein